MLDEGKGGELCPQDEDYEEAGRACPVCMNRTDTRIHLGPTTSVAPPFRHENSITFYARILRVSAVEAGSLFTYLSLPSAAP